MDQQTKAALKQDNFVTSTNTGLHWASANRKSVIVTTSLLLASILLLVGIGIFANRRAAAAADAFGSAMQVYQTPLATSGQPPLPGTKTFPSASDRAAAAYKLFAAAADKYGSTTDGKNAKYLAGVTAMESGQTSTAESTLKDVAGSWNSGIANLSKLALADLYRQTGRDPQAIDLYNQIAAKPSDTVPAATAQIALAELYTAQGKPDQARKIYAQLKDSDKTAKGTPGPAATLAAEKLNPTASQNALPQ